MKSDSLMNANAKKLSLNNINLMLLVSFLMTEWKELTSLPSQVYSIRWLRETQMILAIGCSHFWYSKIAFGITYYTSAQHCIAKRACVHMYGATLEFDAKELNATFKSVVVFCHITVEFNCI